MIGSTRTNPSVPRPSAPALTGTRQPSSVSV